MAAVEYEKCASIHTQRFEYTNRVLSVHFWLLIGTPYILKLSVVSTDSMDIGIQLSSAITAFVVRHLLVNV